MISTRRLGSLIGVLIGVGGIAFVAVRIARDRDDFAEALTSADLRWLLVALVAGLAAMAVIAVNWVGLLARRGVWFRLRDGCGFFFLGQLGKYVPGGIWPVVGQAELARRGGADRSDAYAATVTSMVATLLGAAALSALSGVVSPNARWPIAGALALGLFAGLVVASLRAVRALVEKVTTSVLRRRVLLPAPRLLVDQTLRHVPTWVMFSVMNVCVVVAFDGDVSAGIVFDVSFVTCLSWMAGFVIVGLPGGIGVREAVFVSLATAPLGAGLAVSVAVTSRLVTLAVDLLAAAVCVPGTLARRPDPGDATSP